MLNIHDSIFYKPGIEPEYGILLGNKIKPKLHGSDLF